MSKIKGQFVCIDGEIVRTENVLLSPENRAFKYGDGLFETIRSYNTKLLFFNEHLKRAKKGLDLLKIKYPAGFQEQIHSDIQKLLQTNKHFAGARVRVSFFRKDGGLYTPENNDVSYLIETKELPSEIYEFRKKGIKLGIYNESKVQYNQFSGIKSLNTYPYILAGIYKNENAFDDCLLYNTNTELCEAISSNLFVVKDGYLFTPAIESGCVEGIMRETIIELALSMSIVVFDDAVIRENEILNADEIFLTNAIEGIKWVVAYKNKRYYNKISKKLYNALVKYVCA